MTQGGIQHWLAGKRQPTLDQIDLIATAIGIPGPQLTHGVEAGDLVTDLPDPARRVLRTLIALQREGAGLPDAVWTTIEQVVGLANAALQAKPAATASSGNQRYG